MRNSSIIRILWIAVGIHLLYLILLLFFATNQRQILSIFLPDIQDTGVVAVPFLIMGDLTYFIFHMVFTVLMVKRLWDGDGSILGEVIGAMAFGGVFFYLNEWGNSIAMRLVGYFKGSAALAGYSILKSSFQVLVPLRAIAATLVLLAAGMSIYQKLVHKKSFLERQRQIINLLWGALGLDILHFIVMIAVVAFQNPLKGFYNVEEIQFILPVTNIAGSVVLLIAHILFTAILVYQLKQKDDGIWCEILGVFLFGGILGWVTLFFVFVTQNAMAGKGINAVVNWNIVYRLLRIFSSLHMIAISLFLIGCGMSLSAAYNLRRQRTGSSVKL